MQRFSAAGGTGLSETIDLGRLIGEARWSALQKAVLALSAVAFAMEGLASQAMGPAIPALARAWHVSRGSFAPAAAIGLVGFAFGAAGGGALADRIGRRRTLIGSLLLLGVATIGCGTADDVSAFGLWRVAAGLGLGAAIPVATTVIADFTPLRHRSLAIALGVTFLPLGGFVAGIVAAYLLSRHQWRQLFFAVGGAPVVYAAFLALFLPESPRVLARRPSRRIELLRLLGRLGMPVSAEAVLVDDAAAASAGPAALFERGRRRDTLALWGAFLALVLGMYSLFSWGPEALTTKGFPLAVAAGALSAFAIGGVAGNVFSGWLTEQAGSRVSIAVQMAIGVAAAAALAAIDGRAPHGRQAALAALFVLGASFSGGQTALYALAAHVYPASTRSTGLGAAVAWGRIGAIISAYSGVMALDAGGPGAFFASIGVAAVLATAASLGAANQLLGRGLSSRAEARPGPKAETA